MSTRGREVQSVETYAVWITSVFIFFMQTSRSTKEAKAKASATTKKETI